MNGESAGTQFVQVTSKYDHQGQRRRYERTYCFHSDDGRTLWCCDVFGSCTAAPTEYLTEVARLQPFRMVAKGKFLNATFLIEESSGRRLGSITRKGIGFRWKLLDSENREIARIVDPASKKEAFARELLSGLPDSYAILSEGKVIASIASEPLLDSLRMKPGNYVGRLLNRIVSQNGLTLRFIEGIESSIDLRMLVAAMTLVQVHDITGAVQNN